MDKHHTMRALLTIAISSTILTLCACLLLFQAQREVAEIAARPPEVITNTIVNTEYVEVPVEILVEVPVEPENALHAFYSAIVMTEEERDMLAAVVCLEAGNQSVTGQRCVVEVVFNRVLSDHFPDTVKGVLSQRNQFSTYKNISKAKPGDEHYGVIDMVLASTYPILPPDAVYFATTVANGTKYEKIGNHYFCTW